VTEEVQDSLTGEVVNSSADKRSRRRKRYGVSRKVFIDAWNASNSAQEAADRLKMPLRIAIARACVYRSQRKAEEVVKQMPNSRPKKLDIKALNSFIDSLAQIPRTKEA
jgi:hypothetical protein